MVRAGLLFGVAAAVAFVAGFILPIPFVNLILALGSVAALGWGAGRTTAKVTGAAAGQGTGRGAGAGAIAGLISLIVLTVLLLGLFNIPAVRTLIETQLQQTPEAAGISAAAAGSAVAVILGLFCGGINFFLMLIGGLIGGAMWKGTPNSGEYVAAGRGASGGTGFGTTNSPYDTAGTTGTASTYDTAGTTGGTYGQPGTTGTASTYDASGATSTGYNQPGTSGTGFGTTGTTGDQGDADGGVRVYDTDDHNRS